MADLDRDGCPVSRHGTVVVRPWGLMAMWVGVAAVVWNGFFDILITRGTKEYFMQNALARLGEVPTPSMEAIMARTAHDAAITSSLWGGGVLAAGWLTLWLARRRS